MGGLRWSFFVSHIYTCIHCMQCHASCYIATSFIRWKSCVIRFLCCFQCMHCVDFIQNILFKVLVTFNHWFWSQRCLLFKKPIVGIGLVIYYSSFNMTNSSLADYHATILLGFKLSDHADYHAAYYLITCNCINIIMCYYVHSCGYSRCPVMSSK